jgi:DNA mismatch endonuclease (patch repair protein)
MAAIRSKGNKDTELRLMAIFRSHGVNGWRRNQQVTGRPDFVFRKARVAVFVDGCFWHGCRWHCRMPKSRRIFWKTKISKNRKRDRKVNRLLRGQGWLPVRIWEHSLINPDSVIERTKAALATVVEGL